MARFLGALLADQLPVGHASRMDGRAAEAAWGGRALAEEFQP